MAIAPQRLGIGIRRHFTTPDVHPYDEVTWERRDARITNFRDGSVAFEQLGVEVPLGWSVNATNILAQKYFRGTLGTAERESSLREVVDRVADTITAWGVKDGYFMDEAEAEAFRAELKHLVITQKAAFNSPVWFNIGVKGVPAQASACQPYDAPVSTPEGLTPIGRLVEENAIGTKVFDAHGLTKIVAVKANGRKRVLRIHTKAGHHLDVTPDHLVWRSIADDRGEFVEAGTLRLGDRLEWHDTESSGGIGQLPIEDIGDLGEIEVYDIQTDSGEYLSGNLRVHNCFILAVDDQMDSILNWYVEEGTIFKGGSGSGINLSRIRSSKEGLAGGGTASGPVSFMRGADASAGTIKSGGKCFREGTLVGTPTGLRPIEQLRIGDLVLTHQGPQAVADFMPNSEKQCYLVRTEEGYEVEVTAGHKFAYWDHGEGGFAVKPIEEFLPGDALYALLEPSTGGVTASLLPPQIADPPRATTTVEMSFPTELDDRLAYVVGVSYGDGELRTTYPYRLRVAFCKDPAGQVSAARFAEYCEQLFGERPLVLEDRERHVQIGLTRKRLVDFLAVNGLAKGKGHALGFPSTLYTAEPSVRAAFIAGVIDADGSYQRRGGWAITSIDRTFLICLQRLLLTLGVPSKLKLSRAPRGPWKALYKLHIVGHTFVDRLVEWIKPYSAKAQVNYVSSPGADKGWGYRPSLFKPLVSRVERRGQYGLVDRAVGSNNETSGYGAVATLASHPAAAVAEYASGMVTCVQLQLHSVSPTEVAKTYDIEVEGSHLLAANGIYASNTRRAAKMVILDADHPDIEDFIWCKAIEERKARALRDAGFDMDLDGRDSHSIQYQNANNSVRVTDEFMQAVLDDADWHLRAVRTGEVLQTVKARELFRQIAKATWECADPGMQFDTTINRWHTAPVTGRINASNPCCFVGETLVLTDEGPVPISTLKERCDAGTPLPSATCFSLSTGQTECRPVVKAWVAGYATALVEVVTESGSRLRCTPEHRFLTTAGDYIEAVFLTPGSELRGAASDDRVVSVTKVALEKEVAVYDLEVADEHNFAVATSDDSAVIVHNSEYMHLDNSACNLASLNLLKFLEAGGSFDVEGFRAAVEVVFTAQEILVGNADYPTEKIAETSRRFRQLGIGYANLGALLMAQGLPYDSDEGRAWAGAITALLTGHSFATSARTAARMGPFAGYQENSAAMLSVLRMHRAKVAEIDEEAVPHELLSAAQEAWDSAVELGEQFGVRNSQASVLAPTGCLVGGTLVPTERGLVRLGSLGDVDGTRWQDLDIAVQTDQGPRTATKFFINGVEPVVEVETAHGYRLQGTPQHRIRVVDPATGHWEWKRLADVGAGDLVPLALDQLIGEPQSVAMPPMRDAYWTGDDHVIAPRTMTRGLAELVGYFMGDGYLQADSLRFRVTSGDLDVIARLQVLLKEAFGLESHVSAHQGDTEVRVDSLGVALWWKTCGLDNDPPRIPDAVLQTNDRVVYAAFLRGLFESDGTVTAGYPVWSTRSMDLSHDVQNLLLALGYPTTRKSDVTRTSRATTPLAILRLLNLSANERWLAEIGFISERKSAAVMCPAAKQGARRDHVPLTKELVDRLVPTTDRLRVRRSPVTRQLANELLERTGDAELAHLLSFFYDTVSSAELGEEELTYDLSVPENVTYVANGLVSHNTIGLLLDCDTTGVEPDLGLVKMKKLVGGGTMSIVNQTVPRALRRLGYDEGQIAEIIAYIDEHKSILGAPHLTPADLPVFACSMGDNTIHYMGHVRMMSAVQPFISGAISKCVVGETLLTTAEGLVRVGSLHRGEAPDTLRDEIIEVASVPGTQKTDAFYYGGVRPVREVVLRSGHRVSGTANHRLLVVGEAGVEWRRLDEIAVGDYVATKYGDDLWATVPPRFDDFVPSLSRGSEKAVRLPSEMTEDLAFFLGAYASQGCTVRPVLSVRLTNSVPTVLDRIVEAADHSFGEGARIRRPRDRSAFVELNSKAVVEFLEYLGCGSTASVKRIPDAILRSPREMVLAFLQGLSLGAHIHAPSRKWAIDGLGSPRLLDDLQAVLTNLGIVTERSNKFDPGQNKSYDEVYATGAAAQRVFELVPFIDPEKTAAAARLVRRFRQSVADIVPEASTDRVPDGERPGSLQSILDDNLHFSPVSSVSDVGEREVFDISVPSTQAFVGNGIVNHNTVNMPEEATVEEVEQLHIEAWKMGIKAVAIYRDNCKVAQPLATVKKAAASEAEAHDAELAEKVEKLEKALENQTTVVVKQPIRERLPRRRRSNTFAFRVADCEGYVHVGEYEDGRPGEVFMKVSKQGSTLAGIMDAFAMAVSFGLQHGVPLSLYVRKYTNMRFEPAGMTDDPELRIASSLVDYIFRRLAVDYLPFQERAELGILTTDERIQPTLPGVEEATMPSTGIVVPMDLGPSDDVVDVSALEPPAPVRRPEAQDAPYCYQCGTAMQRAGSCYVCSSCGTTSGCS